MLRPLFTWFLLLTSAVMLAACCGSVACDCQDERADALFFQFDRDTTVTRKGFTTAELRTVYLVRQYLADTARSPTRDTVVVTRTTAEVNSNTPVLINNNVPFVQASNRKVDRYQYQVYVGARTAPTFTLVVDSVELDNRYRADGCCTCYLNTKKNVYLRGNPAPFNAADPAADNQPVAIPVRRP